MEYTFGHSLFCVKAISGNINLNRLYFHLRWKHALNQNVGRRPWPWMQALHCVYGVGAQLGPLIATPILSAANKVNLLEVFRNEIAAAFRPGKNA